MWLHDMVERIGESAALEPLADRLANVLRTPLEPAVLKNALSGVYIGHRLHPLLVPATIGTFASASILDLIGGESSESAADLLVGAGILSTGPTVAAGISDWVDTWDRSRRVGLVHALSNTTAVALYTASLVARRKGRRGAGTLLGLLGFGALSAGGYLGGHLSYVMGVGVNHTAFQEGPKDWTPTMAEGDLLDRAPHVVTAAGNEILLLWTPDGIVALANRCNHAGYPINEGPIEGGCITCPLHGSVYRLRDGEVMRGPAASQQPMYDVRIVEGTVEVRGR